MPRKLRTALIAVLALLILIQFVPVHRGNLPALAPLAAPAEVAAVLERSCYDCHSHQTRWPWYSHVAPISWLVAHDVEEAREHLDFSTWNNLPVDRRAHLFDEIRDEIATGEMPLSSYIWMHPEARLSSGDRETLLRWVQAAGAAGGADRDGG